MTILSNISNLLYIEDIKILPNIDLLYNISFIDLILP